MEADLAPLNHFLGCSPRQLIFHGAMFNPISKFDFGLSVSSTLATQLSVKPTTCQPDWRSNGLMRHSNHLYNAG